MAIGLLARLVRQPFIWLGIVALVIAALFMLESAGSGHPARVIPVHLSSHGATAHHHHCKHGKKHCAKKHKHHHCTDVHGSDNPKNKHCRGGSGGQT